MSEDVNAAEQHDQAQYWNGDAGRRWVRASELLDRALSPHSEAALARAGARAGERVVDVGCGCGDTTLALARAVGPSGRVLGIDVSREMIERAGERVAEAGFGERIRLTLEDAASARFEGDASLLFSRFGVMFFSEPTAAFANLRRALAPGGRV